MYTNTQKHTEKDRCAAFTKVCIPTFHLRFQGHGRLGDRDGEKLDSLTDTSTGTETRTDRNMQLDKYIVKTNRNRRPPSLKRKRKEKKKDASEKTEVLPFTTYTLIFIVRPCIYLPGSIEQPSRTGGMRDAPVTPLTALHRNR